MGEGEQREENDHQKGGIRPKEVGESPSFRAKHTIRMNFPLFFSGKMACFREKGPFSPRKWAFFFFLPLLRFPQKGVVLLGVKTKGGVN